MAEEPTEAAAPEETPLPTDVQDAAFDSAVDEVVPTAPAQAPGSAAPRPAQGPPPPDKGGEAEGDAQKAGAKSGESSGKAEEQAGAKAAEKAEGEKKPAAKDRADGKAADDQAAKKDGKGLEKDADGKTPTAAERAEARAKEMADESARLQREKAEKERARQEEESARREAEQSGTLTAFRERLLSVADKAGFKVKIGSDDGKGEVELSLKEYAERYPALMDAQLFVQQTLLQEQVAPLREQIERMDAVIRIQRLGSVLARPDMGGHADAADVVLSDDFQTWLAKDATAGIRACAASSSPADNRMALEAYKDAKGIQYGEGGKGGDDKPPAPASTAAAAREKRETVLRATLRSRGAGAPPASQEGAGEEDKDFESAADEFEQGRRRR